MKEVAELNVKQVRIFAPDCLPVMRLTAPPVASAFKECFSWLNVGTTGEGELVFGPGSVGDTAEDAVVIRTLRVSDRRLTLDIAGESSEANRVHGALLDFLAKEVEWKRCEPVVTTEESTCVATLDFDWTALLSPTVLDFGLGRMLQALSGEAKAEVAGLSFSFSVRYPALPGLVNYGVGLADKKFTVEPRVSTPLDARRYYSVAPTDSATHLRLLEELERALSRSSEHRGRR